MDSYTAAAAAAAPFHWTLGCNAGENSSNEAYNVIIINNNNNST